MDKNNKEERTYIAIDLKSFYASVECVERNLDPLTTNLVVADKKRTEKTICLAVSPSLKEYNISGRARLYQVIEQVKRVNISRKNKINNKEFSASSYDKNELNANPNLALDYIVAPPRMKKYMEYSAKIYSIYLKYIAPEDIHVYSVDECFIDVTNYLGLYKTNAKDLATTMIRDVLQTTGITATAGIGTNLYLCKVALDIVAKHMPANEIGARIASLDEQSYRKLLWDYRPITDFWRVGRGIAKRLAKMGIYTMGDIALCSIHNEDSLYNAFGINAELLIDHAWGIEPVMIKHIKEYKPETNSISTGQVLQSPYEYEKARIIVHEMADLLSLDLVDKELFTDQIVLSIGYDRENLSDPKKRKEYKGETVMDRYGRIIPKSAHGSINLGEQSQSTRLIIEKTLQLFEQIIDKSLTVRRVTICANHVVREDKVISNDVQFEQLNLFENYDKVLKEKKIKERNLKQEKNLSKALIQIQKRYGKNAILKGLNYRQGATTRQRNGQVGGHKA